MTGPYSQRNTNCCEQLRHPGIAALLLIRPSKMFQLTGDRHLCAYAMLIAGRNTNIIKLHGCETLTLHPRVLAGFDQTARY